MSPRDLTALFFTLVISAGNVSAQKFNFENYSVNEGLPNNVVKSISQDELGFMYFGTNNGLAVYDGSVISAFPLPGTGNGQQVFRMKALASGKLWINYTGNKDLHWISRGIMTNAGIINRYDINNIYEKPGPAYVCTDWGLFAVKGRKMDKVIIGLKHDDRVIHYLEQIGTDRILVGRKGFSMALLNADYKILDETNEDISVNEIRRSPDGDYWIATDSHGLLILDGKMLDKGKLVFKANPPSLSFLGKEDIFCIGFSRDDQSLLLGTSHYGVLTYRRDGSVLRMDKDNGLSGNKVNCMYLDRDRTWWIGTDFGVDKLSSTSFMFFGIRGETAISSTFRMEKDSAGRTWFFGNEHFYYTDHDFAVRAEYPPGVEKIALGSSATKDGIWVSVPNNIFFIDTRGDVPVVHKAIQTPDTYRRMARWGNSIMMGGKRTLALLENGKLKILSDKFIDIRAVCTDRFGKLWIGTFSDGLFRLNLRRDRDSYKVEVMQQILDSNSSYNRFLALMPDDKGRIWAGTRFHGVYVYEVNEHAAVKKKEFGMKEGLGNNYITSLSQCRGGDTWIGTSTGFDRYTENASGYTITRLSSYYRFNNSVRELMADSAYLWAATDVGAIRIKLAREKHYQFPTYFKEIIFPDSTWHLFTTDTVLHFRPDQNSFSVTFTAPFYINERQTQYFYRLIHDGVGEWIEVRANHSINFNSLRSGRYILQLRSIPFNGQSGYLVSRLTFIIATPFYRSTWFIIVMALTVVLLAYLFYRYRIRELKKLYMVRDNISRNLHDEIGATLSSINIYSDVARHKVDESSEVRPWLDRIYTGSGQVMENMNDIVWYVNPKNDSWEDILVRMREFAIPILEARNIDVSFTADEKLLHQKLSMQQRQNIYYIFKEAVNNIAKYSQATVVEIGLLRTGSGLTLSISDNGMGFSETTVKKGNGLMNMQQRAGVLKASLSIESGRGKGTAIRLHLQIP